MPVGTLSYIPLLLAAAIQYNVKSEVSNSGLRSKYDGYGEEWIFMPDGKGKPQVAILKGMDENEARGVFDSFPITYILYTRDGPEKGENLYTNDTEALKNSNFSPSRKTKLITHGWKSSAFTSSIVNMKSAYLSHDDYNVILVDWEPLAASTFYLGPMKNTNRVGKDAGKFIDFLVTETGLKTQDVHFLGHSLGAHVAGNAGAATFSGKLGRVTGLDPALPGIHIFTTEEGRLDASDAEFVDIIHSCGGVLGFLQPLGQVDFYPNGGTAVQPGCCCIPEVMDACSHGRSYLYFTESINSKTGLVATKCDTWDKYMRGDCAMAETVLMGEHVDRNANGSYFLHTRSESPFSYISEIEDNNV